MQSAVIPAETKWRAGTPWDFALGGLGLGFAVRDDNGTKKGLRGTSPGDAGLKKR